MVPSGLVFSAESIIPDSEEHPYHPFRQTSNPRPFGGSGLGQSFHGGTLWGLEADQGIVDKMDRVLAEHCGFTEEELDSIINYDLNCCMGHYQ